MQSSLLSSCMYSICTFIDRKEKSFIFRALIVLLGHIFKEHICSDRRLFYIIKPKLIFFSYQYALFMSYFLQFTLLIYVTGVPFLCVFHVTQGLCLYYTMHPNNLFVFFFWLMSTSRYVGFLVSTLKAQLIACIAYL